MEPIKMVDLHRQHKKIKPALDAAYQKVLEHGQYINGPEVQIFSDKLKQYVGSQYVIPCANGTDALQLALMALDLAPGTEVLVPSFNYVAAAEAIALLGLIPVFCDVDVDSFNLSPNLDSWVTPKTKAIVVVHLFGFPVQMEKIMEWAKNRNFFVIEDVAQSLGSQCLTASGWKFAGTFGDIGITSFFPSKNLGCLGDGGAIFTQSETLAFSLKSLASHGQTKKYQYQKVGVNSRLDTLQAAFLNVKTDHLDSYISARRNAAKKYTQLLAHMETIELPMEFEFGTHTYNQFTLKVDPDIRTELMNVFTERKIPFMVYYPHPLHTQEAYASFYSLHPHALPHAELLCKKVISLPIHTELDTEQQEYIAEAIQFTLEKVI